MVSFAILAAVALPLALLFYIWIFIFVSGSANKGQAYDQFIMDICSKSTFSFFKTLLSFGYLKRSFKTFYRYYRLKFFPVEFAQLGKKSPDAKLIDLNGNEKSLLKDYIEKSYDMPLILNMGSYT